MDYILILPGGLEIGGAERVAANISRYAPEGEFLFHYVIFEGYDNVYGPEIEARGGKVFSIPSPRKGYRQYIAFLNSLMEKYHYKAVHSHTMFNSGINLYIAKRHGIPVRICHSHTTKTEVKSSLKQRLYEKLMRIVIKHTATDYFACGVEAGNWQYGKKFFDKKGEVILNGIDVESNVFNETYRAEIRKELGLENKFVIGHSGHLYPVKNHMFLIELMPEILKKRPDAVLLCLGEGHEREKLEGRIKELELSDKVILYGLTMKMNCFYSAFDVFAFPSLREGTPLALLEAQANGLPCIISSAIPKDAFLTDLITPIPLTEKEQWIDAISTAERKNPEKYAKIVCATGYSSLTSCNRIYEVYRR